MQMKCVEKFKYEKHADINWSEAFTMWINEGFAKLFGDYYNEDIRFHSLYRKIMDASTTETE